MKFPWNPKTDVLSTSDTDILIDLFNQSLQLAKELSANDKELFKTTFQCIFWEGCHYVFGKKLRELKK